MSNAIFPTLPGLRWSRTKAPEWNTVVQTSASGRETRSTATNYPTWRFTLSYEVLRANALAELQSLLGFFNDRRGSWDSFLYQDPDDYEQSTPQLIGVVSPQLQRYPLLRPIGPHLLEPVLALKGKPNIYVNGQLRPDLASYTTNGILDISRTPISVGSRLAWSGQFYYRCRFLHDTLELEQFLYQLWAAKRVEFVSLKP